MITVSIQAAFGVWQWSLTNKLGDHVASGECTSDEACIHAAQVARAEIGLAGPWRLYVDRPECW